MWQRMLKTFWFLVWTKQGLSGDTTTLRFACMQLISDEVGLFFFGTRTKSVFDEEKKNNILWLCACACQFDEKKKKKTLTPDHTYGPARSPSSFGPTCPRRPQVTNQPTRSRRRCYGVTAAVLTAHGMGWVGFPRSQPEPTRGMRRRVVIDPLESRLRTGAPALIVKSDAPAREAFV